MNFTLARDIVCTHLANVRDKQKELALNSGASEDWISQIIDFVIFPKKLRYPDIEDMPCAFVYFNRLDFPEDEQNVYSNSATGNLVIEFYTVGLNEESETETTQTADSNAEDRLEYLTAQIYKFLCSEATNVYTASNDLIKEFRIKSWERILTPEGNNSAGTVLGAKLEFSVGLDEETYYAETTEIKELYTSLNIREEFIDPFVRQILN
jgi:hypothetical protein